MHCIDNRPMTDVQHAMLVALLRSRQSRNDAEYDNGNLSTSRYTQQNKEITELLNLVEGK